MQSVTVSSRLNLILKIKKRLNHERRLGVNFMKKVTRTT